MFAIKATSTIFVLLSSPGRNFHFCRFEKNLRHVCVPRSKCFFFFAFLKITSIEENSHPVCVSKMEEFFLNSEDGANRKEFMSCLRFKDGGVFLEF